MTRPFSSICAFCGYEHSLTTNVSERATAPLEEPRMEPGDATMCIQCGEMNVLGKDDMLRKPTEEEADQLARDPRVMAIQDAWRDVKAKRQ